MHFEGQQTINTPIGTVWAWLMDPHQVSPCAPGYLGIEVLEPDHFKPTMAVGVGPVKATFTLDVRLVDLRAPHHAAMTARGVAAGSAVDAQSSMDLVAESDTSTEMTWTMDVV